MGDTRPFEGESSAKTIDAWLPGLPHPRTVLNEIGAKPQRQKMVSMGDLYGPSPSSQGASETSEPGMTKCWFAASARSLVVGADQFFVIGGAAGERVAALLRQIMQQSCMPVAVC
jgi:hypothetical protein